MKDFQLIPYKAEHAFNLFERPFRSGEYLDVSQMEVLKEVAQWREKSGVAFTLMLDDDIVGCGGMDIVADQGNVWLLLSDLANKYPKYVTRVVKTTLAGIIREWNITHLVADAEVSDGKAQMYLQALGFKEDQKITKGLDGRKYLTYRRAA